MFNEKAVVLMSGGPDSFAAASWSKHQFSETVGLFVDVGHCANENERRHFRNQTNYLSIEGIELDLGSFMSSFSEIGSNGRSIFKGAGLPLLPFSSGIALTIGSSVASSKDASNLVLGLHAVDFDVDQYSLTSIRALALAAELNDPSIKIHLPFESMSKVEVFKYGIRQGIPLENSWSCLGGNIDHCGACQPCLSRANAFELARKIEYLKHRSNR
jgi:7-cyano-7-deazaguanine synthase